MAAVDEPIGTVSPTAGTRDGGADRAAWLLASASLGCAILAIVAIAWATASRNHAFWAFALWVGCTVGAVTIGVTALVRTPRRSDQRSVRRMAAVGVVAGVLCATLGLAVYSASRTDDCPLEKQCTIPESGPGQRKQQP